MASKLQLVTHIFAGILLVLTKSDSKTVVLLSLPHAANVRTHTNLARALTDMGHEAYVLIPQFMLDNKMVNVEGIKVISYGDYLGNMEEKLTAKMLENFWKFGKTGLSDSINVMKAARDTVPQILSDRSLIARLQEIKPDLFLLTNAPQFKNIVILPYMLNSSFLYMSPYYDAFGCRVPYSLSTTPCQGFGFTTNSFINRLKNSLCHSVLMALDYFMANESMVEEFAPHRPLISVNTLARQAQLFLVESDHILDFAKPQLPNMKLIGSIAPTPGKQLKNPFKNLMENSKSGAAVVTFGSSIVNIPERVAKKMYAAFELQDLDVVWRTNYTSTNTNKILSSAWIPQNDLLAHPKTKLFVSHCGANGQYEALYHGVPILCLPIFGDQTYNARRSTVKGFGLDANILEVSETELASLMKEVSGNGTYRTNIQKASTLFKLLYKEPDKTAAFWVDHILEFSGSYMRSPGQDMPLYQFLALDVFGFLLFIFALFVFFLFRVCQCCCRCWCNRNKKRTETKNKND